MAATAVEGADTATPIETMPAATSIESDTELPAELVKRAAQAICGADFLLISGGAGMSADSGLPTFSTLTQKLGDVLGGLTYDQAAGSNTMFQDPELFYGFWFLSMRSYAEAQPHDGYSILRHWTELTAAKGRQQENAIASLPESRVFALTTNVDKFLLRSGVAPKEAIGEIHGSVTKWQCGGVPSGKKFPLVQRDRCGDALFDAPEPPDGMDYEACRLRGPPPRCPHCGDGWARPHIFLFGDGNRFVDNREALGIAAYDKWKEAVMKALKANVELRFTIVEIGCGLRVPNLRKRCEELLSASPSGQCEFVRINPEFEDHKIVASPTIVIKASALAGLRMINREVGKLVERTS